MKPTEFKHQNVVFGSDQPEYQALPALKLSTLEGEVITCWKLSFWERIQLLITGKVWLSIMTFNQPIMPSFMSVNRKDVYSLPTD